MADPTAILKEIFKSKEYKELVKCSKKHCVAYNKLLEKEKVLSEKIIKLNDELQNVKTTTEMVSKTKEMVKISKEMAKLGENKEAMTCAMKKCSTEFNDMMAYKSNVVAKQMGKYEAAMKKM